MNTIQVNGFTVNIIRSKRRKTMALKVDTKGVSVHIPATLPTSTAKTFIHQKSNWIKKKLAFQKEVSIQQKQFIDGELFFYLGKQYTLRFYQTDTPPILTKTTTKLEFSGWQPDLSKAAIRAVIIDWYKDKATAYLKARTQWLSEISGLRAKSVEVKSYKARWGSCSNHGDIKLNWQLIQAPESVIDYVIFHELSHLVHHNHSAEFWHLLEQFCPDFKSHRIWLKTRGHTITI